MRDIISKDFYIVKGVAFSRAAFEIYLYDYIMRDTKKYYFDNPDFSAFVGFNENFPDKKFIKKRIHATPYRIARKIMDVERI